MKITGGYFYLKDGVERPILQLEDGDEVKEMKWEDYSRSLLVLTKKNKAYRFRSTEGGLVPENECKPIEKIDPETYWDTED